MKYRHQVVGGIRVNTYGVLSRAVEEGVAIGYQHAFKHTDKPDEDALKDSIEQEVMNAICEVFDFFGDKED